MTHDKDKKTTHGDDPPGSLNPLLDGHGRLSPLRVFFAILWAASMAAIFITASDGDVTLYSRGYWHSPPSATFLSEPGIRAWTIAAPLAISTLASIFWMNDKGLDRRHPALAKALVLFLLAILAVGSFFKQ